MDKPLVSVIIPVYNGEKHIRETLESVKSQTYDNVEIILVDDGSTDDTGKIAESLVNSYIHQENMGVASARNTGIKSSKGDYLAFIDADDKWDCEKLQKQIGFMEDNPSISYTFTKHKLFLDRGMERFPDWIRKDYEENEMTGYIPSSLIIRKEDFLKIGYFDESFKTGEDSDWFLRARDLGFKMEVIDENLLMKRVHESNLSSNTAMTNINLMKAVKNSIIRRKKHRISVVIPVYNGEKYIDEAIESVMNQSFKISEILVVDDGSTDNTEAVCKKYGDKITYLKQENSGAASARNLGVEKSTGIYLAFLDADDIWMEDRLRDGISEITKEDSEDIIFGMMKEFYSPDTDDDFRNKYKCRKEPFKGIHPGTMLIRKEDFLKAGYLTTKYETGEFIDWFKRAEEEGLTSKTLPSLVMRRRIHYTNHGITHKKSNEDYGKIIIEMMKRRREKNNEQS
jgi:glycosyltransferase involved in cell wall biosynthesis